MICRECGAECAGELCGIHRPFDAEDTTEDLLCPGELLCAPTKQLGLFERPLAEATVTPEMTVRERFEAFHAANPHVLEALRELALRAHNRGQRRIGIKMLWEVLRWERMMRTIDPSSEFRLNNNYHSRYARLLMEHEPALSGSFELRRLKTEEVAA